MTIKYLFYEIHPRTVGNPAAGSLPLVFDQGYVSRLSLEVGLFTCTIPNALNTPCKQSARRVVAATVDSMHSTSSCTGYTNDTVVATEVAF